VSSTSFISCVVGKRCFLTSMTLDVNSDFPLIGGISFWYVLFLHIVCHIVLGSAKDMSFC
jgi:hypothetical protein